MTYSTITHPGCAIHIIRISDDQPKDALTQWDLNRQVSVPECDEVHFAMRRDKQSLVVLPHEEGSKLVADVPNQLLIRHGTLMIWAVKDDQAISWVQYRVLYQPKPTDYVYEPTEIVNVIEMLESLDERVTKLESEGIGQAGLPARLGSVTVERIDGDSYGDVECIDEETNTYAIHLYLGYDAGSLTTEQVESIMDTHLGEYAYVVNTAGELLVGKE